MSSGAGTITGVKPAGATPVLIINCRSTSAIINVTIDGSAAVLVYAPAAFPATSLTVTPNTIPSTLYHNDAPPSTMLVTAKVKTYETSSISTQDNVYQDTFTVGTLP
jgi:hypothetical protein